MEGEHCFVAHGGLWRPNLKEHRPVNAILTEAKRNVHHAKTKIIRALSAEGRSIAQLILAICNTVELCENPQSGRSDEAKS